MKTMKHWMSRFFRLVAVGMVMWAGASCSSDTEELMVQPEATGETVHTAVMHLTGGLQSYTPKRETSTEWNEGDVIYLRFYQADENTVVCGKAIYDASSSLWNISYYGNLDTGSTLKCEAFYFVNATATDNYNVGMTPQSGVYVDEAATYMVDGGELFVSAVLAPKTARMRIKGEAGKEVTVSGVICYSSFNLLENEFIVEKEDIGIQVKFGEDGYTPYIYCALGKTGVIMLADAYYEYTKVFESAKFVPGESGFVTMPTQTLNKGWEFTYYYPSRSVDLGLSVRWAECNLGGYAEQYRFMDGTYCSWGDAFGSNTLTTSSYHSDLHEIAGNPEYDIATNLWGERWQIPTQEQWQELIDECTWVYNYTPETGVYAYTITGPNGNKIYLPMYDYVTGTAEPDDSYTTGYYWCSTESSSSYKAYYMYLTKTGQSTINDRYKYYRMQIRPVLIK